MQQASCNRHRGERAPARLTRWLVPNLVPTYAASALPVSSALNSKTLVRSADTTHPHLDVPFPGVAWTNTCQIFPRSPALAFHCQFLGSQAARKASGHLSGSSASSLPMSHISNSRCLSLPVFPFPVLDAFRCQRSRFPVLGAFHCQYSLPSRFALPDESYCSLSGDGLRKFTGARHSVRKQSLYCAALK